MDLPGYHSRVILDLATLATSSSLASAAAGVCAGFVGGANQRRYVRFRGGWGVKILELPTPFNELFLCWVGTLEDALACYHRKWPGALEPEYAFNGGSLWYLPAPTEKSEANNEQEKQ